MHMIGLTNSDGHERLAKRRRYRFAYVGSSLAGVLAMFLALRLDRPLVGIGLYWLGVAGMAAIFWLSPVELFDERERSRERLAALRTIQIVGVVAIVAVPGLVALEEVGYATITPAISGVFLGYAALAGLFGVVYALLWLDR